MSLFSIHTDAGINAIGTYLMINSRKHLYRETDSVQQDEDPKFNINKTVCLKVKD